MPKTDNIVVVEPLMDPSVAMQILAPPKNEISAVQALLNADADRDENAFEMIPIRVKIAPGGTGHFISEDGNTMPELHGTIAFSREVRGYWPDKNSNNKPPLCSSPNGDIGYLIDAIDGDKQMLIDAATAFKPHPALPLIDAKQPIPEQFSCSKCPLSKWRSEHQSGNGGKGKACKEMRRLVMILDGYSTPVIFTLPPTSCRPFDLFFSGLESRGFKYYGVRVRVKQNVLKSNDGNKYGVAQFELAGYIEDMEHARAVISLREKYEDWVNDMAVAESEIDDSAPTATPTTADESVPF